MNTFERHWIQHIIKLHFNFHFFFFYYNLPETFVSIQQKYNHQSTLYMQQHTIYCHTICVFKSTVEAVQVFWFRAERREALCAWLCSINKAGDTISILFSGGLLCLGLRRLWSTGAASGSGSRGAFWVRGHNTSETSIYILLEASEWGIVLRGAQACLSVDWDFFFFFRFQFLHFLQEQMTTSPHLFLLVILIKIPSLQTKF